MKFSDREAEATSFVALGGAADQDWHSVVASYSQVGWPPPSWLPLSRTEAAERVAPGEVITKAS